MPRTRAGLPAVDGRLVRYLPPEGDGVRVDTGVFEGAEITLHYDPIIAKLVACAPNRGEAIEPLRAALDAFYLSGVHHNIAFLAAVLAKPRFLDGALSTNFLAQEFPGGFAPQAGSAPADQLIRFAAAVAERDSASGTRRSTPRRPAERAPRRVIWPDDKRLGSWVSSRTPPLERQNRR